MSLDVASIVDALAALRTESGAMQASTMTFAVFHENDQIGSWVDERARMLADKHPSRVLIFDGRHDPDDHRIAPGDARGEWIEIGVRGASGADLGDALAMLEVPSAPVVLLWAAEHITDDERFLALAQRATAVICSSSLTHADGEGLRDLAAFVDAHAGIDVQDVAYLRLGSWQELIAEFFDDPAQRSNLYDLQRIELAAGSDAEMYYVLGWLASRLGWTPQSANRLATPKGTVEFSMRRDGPPRRLSSIELIAPTASYTAAVQPDDESTICMLVNRGAQSVKRCAPLHSVDLASLVERAILEGTHDEVFVESMTMARQILEQQHA